MEGHTLNLSRLGYHQEDFTEPTSEYILFLGDCAATNNQVLSVFENAKINFSPFQIQGGKGWNFDYHKLKFCKGFILINGWANHASVIEDTTEWNTRVDNQIEMLNSISSQGSRVSMIDRPGCLERYIEDSLLKSIDSNPDLGIDKSLAIKNGWKPQQEIDQKNRRQKYKEKLDHIFRLDHVNYLDLQEKLPEQTIQRHCLEQSHRFSGVINSAPWHLSDIMMSHIAELSIYLLKNLDSSSYINNIV